MENQLRTIIEGAVKATTSNTETKEELETILRANGGSNFMQLGNCLFTVNEHEIFEGIGFDVRGEFKIWNNSKFGTFKNEN